MSKVSVRVPDEHGKAISVRYGGGAPTVYHVRDGRVSVEPNRLRVFLSMVEGAEVVDGNSGADTVKEEG